MKHFILAILIAMSGGLIAASAQNVMIDEPEDEFCYFQTDRINEKITRFCTAWWSIPDTLYDNDGTLDKVPEGEVGSHLIESVLKGAIVHYPENDTEPIFVDDSDIIEKEPTRHEIIREEREQRIQQMLDQLEDCDAIVERFAGIQQEGYITELEIPESPFIIDDYARAGLEGDLNKALEACDIMIEFQDQLIELEKKYLDNLENFYVKILDETRSYEDIKTATEEELRAEAEQWREWACADVNAHLRLCQAYIEWTGENRGNPEPVISDPAMYQEYLSAKAARDQTEADYERQVENAFLRMCEEYTPLYAHLNETDQYPEFLEDCP